MTKEDFNYLSDWLYNSCKVDYESDVKVKELAERSYKPLKGVISALWAMFDRHICEEPNKVIRYGEGVLFAYNGKWFNRIDDATFMEELIRRVLGRLGVQPVYQLEGAKKIASPLMSRLRLTDECQYKHSRRWVCFTNGVLDLKTRMFKNFSINYPTNIVLDFDYNPKASSILWDSKLKQIIPNDGFRSDFQQFCGSLLADRELFKAENICYLYGAGGNGKSVLASAISHVFGTKFVSTFSLDQIFAKETASLFVVKEMSGKILNVCDDCSDKSVSGGQFKRFVSGDPIQGRGVGKGDWTKITPPMLLNCINFFPDVDDDSEGNHRRQLIIETTLKQWDGEERDTQLTAKLSMVESRQAIFNWIYEGFKKYVANNGTIKLSQDGIIARLRRKEDSSPMRRWASERCFVKAIPVDNSDPRWLKLVDLYADYRAFCIESGYRYEADARKIAAMFVSMGCAKKNLSGRGTRVCVGRLNIDTSVDGGVLSE